MISSYSDNICSMVSLIIWTTNSRIHHIGKIVYVKISFYFDLHTLHITKHISMNVGLLNVRLNVGLEAECEAVLDWRLNGRFNISAGHRATVIMSSQD